MHHSTILLPFALAPAEHAKDLLATLHAPALAQLLSHAYPGRQTVSDAFASLPPHEQWVARDTDDAGDIKGIHDNSPAIAHELMHQLGMAPEPGYWFVLAPAHFHVARDHLVLTDGRQLVLNDTTSQTLFDAAHALFAELGYTLRYGDARHWFLRADAWSGLRTCSPDAACGHNIDVWLPRGQGERDWRRLHNEVQMLWHTHEINEAREQRGERRVNALWLWGGSDGTRVQAGRTGLRELARCSLGLPAPLTVVNDAPVLVDVLIGAALASDWSSWLAAMAELDARLIAPMLAQLRNGEIDDITLVLTDSTRAIEWKLRRSSMRKFWVRTSLARLAP
ncbi:hypothetical protein MCEGEM3_02749 [Oxalobacteraceae bacterium]